MVAVTELVDRLGMIGLLGAAVGPIKERDRGFGAGELLVGLASAQLAGEDFLVGLDRQCDDVAGQEISPVAGLSSTTAAGLARRFIAPLRRLLAGLSEKDWADAVGMDGAQVAVSSYRPAWWPSKTEILIRRVKLDISQVSADSRSRRRRTLHPDQRGLPLGELAKAGDIYAYSFVCTNIDMSTPGKAVAVEYWYRQRTTTREHLPGQQARCRTTSSAQWLSGSQHRLDAALLAANMAAWVHELTGTLGGGGETVTGHGPWRQGHDRHSSPPAHPRSRPPDQPRGAAHTQASAGS
jgi:hypothetical protein